MRITKVKYDGKRTLIKYEQDKQSAIDHFEIESKDAPMEAFQKALQAFAADVIDICGLPDYYSKNITVRGISLSYHGEDKTIGLIITALKTLETAPGPLLINTPFLPANPLGKNKEDARVQSIECSGHIVTLIDQAKRYVDGERAQTEMFEEAETKK